MQGEIQVFIRAEEKESGIMLLSKVIEFKNGNTVKIPINKDGTIKWFDDSRLLKK